MNKQTSDEQQGIHDMLSIREQLIPKIMSENQAGHVVMATRGLLLGLVSSKDTFKVSTLGTSFLHGYLVALESKLAEVYGIEVQASTTIQDVEYEDVPCDRCMATGKIKLKGVRSIKLGICPRCHGKGNNLIEIK